MLNKNQAHGTIQEIAGRIQEKSGKIFGSKAQQVRGIENQVIGKADRGLGNFRDRARDARSEFKGSLRD